MSGIYNILPVTYRQYRDALRDNNNGTIPSSEKAEIILVPLVLTSIVVWLTEGNVAGPTQNTLLTIFGIFASVLITSFAPLLDFTSLIIAPAANSSGLTDSEAKVNDAVMTARSYLFAFNCMSLLLSLFSIFLLFIYPYFKALAAPNWSTNWESKEFALGLFGNYLFPAFMFFVIFQCLYNVIKTLLIVIKLFGQSQNSRRIAKNPSTRGSAVS